MPSAHTGPFEDYSELIHKPLAVHDPKSLAIIDKLLTDAPAPQANPLSFLIESLSNVRISPKEARFHWKKIVDHKRRLELKLCRPVNIRTAAIDYYDQMGIDAAVLSPVPASGPGARFDTNNGQTAESPAAPKGHSSRSTAPEKSPAKHATEADHALARVYEPGYYQERLKEELMRARRYKHALSAILFDVDLSVIGDSPTAGQTRDKVLGIVVKLINKAVRTVDILARRSDNLFLLILPNTNKREALELAERLQKNIGQRMLKLPEFPGGIPLTIGVGQCSCKNESSTEFLQRLENLVISGRRKNPNTVYSLE